MLDYFEYREQRCEDWAFDNVVGDEAVCSCGKKFKLSEGEMLSPDPYGVPVCPDCFAESVQKKRRLRLTQNPVMSKLLSHA